MSAAGERFRVWATARHFAQFGIVIVLVWLIFIATDLQITGNFPIIEKDAIEVSVAAFGLLFAVVFHFFGRDRIGLAVLAIVLVALGWFSITGGSDLPGWMSLNWLLHKA